MKKNQNEEKKSVVLIAYTTARLKLKRKFFRCWVYGERLCLYIKQHPEYLTSFLTLIIPTLPFISGYDFHFLEILEVLLEFLKNIISIVAQQVIFRIRKITGRKKTEDKDQK